LIYLKKIFKKLATISFIKEVKMFETKRFRVLKEVRVRKTRNTKKLVSLLLTPTLIFTSLAAGMCVNVRNSNAASVKDDNVAYGRDVIGRGLDLLTAGKDYVPTEVVTNQTSHIFDIDSPCVTLTESEATDSWSTITRAETAEEWSMKYSIGLSGEYDAVNTKGTPSVTDPGNDTPRPATPAEYDMMKKGAASGSFGANFGSSKSYDNRSIYFKGDVHDIAQTITTSFAQGIPNYDTGVCEKPTDGSTMTLQQQLQANMTDDFKNAIATVEAASPETPSDGSLSPRRLAIRNLLDEYGDYVILNAGFGGSAAVRYQFQSKVQGKSTNADANFEATDKGITGGGTGSWDTSDTYTVNNGTLVTSSYGGYSQPKWNSDTSNANNASVIADWQKDLNSAPEEKRAFIGPAQAPSTGSADDDDDVDIAFKKMGAYIWDFIADQKVSDEVCAEYGTELLESGKAVDAIAASVQAPYLKDIVMGYAPDLQEGAAKANLDSRVDALMNQPGYCNGSCYFVKMYNGLSNDDSLNSGNAGDEIYAGYILQTNLDSSIITGFNVKASTKDDVKNKYSDSDMGALDLNRYAGAGSDYIYITDVTRYDPNTQSTPTTNLPLTGIGLENKEVSLSWPDINTVGVSSTSTGPIRTDNQTIWHQIGTNLNKGAIGDNLYMYYSH
jgi:hypothetical protein